VADRDVTVRLRADIASYQRDMAAAAASTQAFARNAQGSGKEIDKLSGRLRLATDAALIFGGALAPLGAAAIGGVVALSAQLGSMAGALGVTLLAVHGLGDGLKALDAYQLSPTAENLAKLNQQMANLGPSGEHFVRFLDSLEPDLKSLQMAARDGLFPGAEAGIDSLLQRLPEVRSLVSGIADELGKLAADAGAQLGGPKFDAFFKYLRTDGIKILDDTSRTLGNLAEAAANTFAAFGGVSTDFSGGLLKFSQELADASANLSTSAGFQEFVQYIETAGPQVLSTLEAVGNALLQVVEATAPLGGPVLTGITAFANAIAKIADSDIGTPIFAALAALALLNRSVMLTDKLMSATFGGPAVTKFKGYAAGLTTVVSAQQRAQMSATELDAANTEVSRSFGKFALPAAGLALTMSGIADNTGLANTAMLSLAGPWGAAAGFALDMWHATDGLKESMKTLDLAMASGDVDTLTAALQGANAELEKAHANTILGSSAFGDFAGSIVNTIAPASNMEKFMGMLTGKTGDLEDKSAAAAKELAGLADGSIQAFNPVHTLASAIQDTTEAAQQEAQALQAATDAMEAHRSEALKGVNAALDYQAAIDDANKALKDNGKNADATTEKGRANLKSLYALASAWNAQSNAAKNAKGSLEDARHNFIDTAEQMGVTADKAHQLANKLFEIPPKRKTQIELDGADEAISKVKTLADLRNALHSKDITIALHYQTIGNRGPTGGGPLPGGQPQADGGTVGGARHPYGDKVLSMLAPGEEVISNRHGQADRFRADRAAGRIPGYANGGTAGSTYTSMVGGGNAVAGVQVWTSGVYSIAKALKAFKAELDAASKSVDKEKQARDDLISAEQAFMQSVGGAYSKADLFSGGLSDFDTGLSANINDTQAAQAALATAAAHGLNGPLYQALAASGNLSLLQEFAGLSSDQIGIREQQFAAQSNAQSTLGASAATAAGFTQAIKDQTKELKEAQQERKQLAATIKELQAKLPGKVEDGARKGIAEREKRTHTRVRTG
jgi:hypothetical protein